MAKAPLVVGNWKMNGMIGETLKRLTALERQLEDTAGIEVVVAPPFTALYSAGIALQDFNIKLGAQNLYYENEGAFTGEISGPFLKDVGCEFVIVGHSERRHIFKEDDELVNRKVRAGLAADLEVIFCVGETLEEREANKTFDYIEHQLNVGLQELHIHDIEAFSIAYEPVWAIGTGKNATSGQVGEVHDWIRNFLGKRFDAPTANDIRLLYGGSVKAANAKSLIESSNVDGLLVGGASLDPEEFVEIIQNVGQAQSGE